MNIPSNDSYKNDAWKDYTPEELEQWVHLLTKRAGHRNDSAKAKKDLDDAENYQAMFDARLLDTPSEFVPDDTRKLQLEGFINTVCVGSTGRLGICTHVIFAYDGWIAAGFGLDGKGTWTASNPIELGTAETFYDRLVKRFGGALCNADKVDVFPEPIL